MGWENPGPARRVIIAGIDDELLVYTPLPGPGNLIAAIGSQAGTDKYGNPFNEGFTVLTTGFAGYSLYKYGPDTFKGGLFLSGADVLLAAVAPNNLLLDSFQNIDLNAPTTRIVGGSFSILDSGTSSATILAGTNSILTAAITIPSGISNAKVFAMTANNGFAANSVGIGVGPTFQLRIFKTDGTNVAANTTVSFQWMVIQ